MTGYESKRAAAQAKLDDDDTLTIAYQSGYYDGKKAAQPAQEPPQYSFKAYWAEDGRIGVVGCIIRPDGGPHILEEFIDPPQATEKYTYGTPLLDAMTKDHVAPQPAQEPVAYLCKPDQHGLFNHPTPDKACKDCFPVYAAPPQLAQELWRESASDYERGVIDGRLMQAQSSVDKAVNAMTQRPWVGLTDDEFKKMIDDAGFTRTDLLMIGDCVEQIADLVEATLRSKNT